MGFTRQDATRAIDAIDNMARDAESIKNTLRIAIDCALEAQDEIQSLRAENERLDKEIIDEVGERERLEALADSLAHKIAALEGLDIGEHSSCNCPWQNALDGVNQEPE